MPACVLRCSVLFDSVTPWAVTCQAPLSTGFFKQEYWSELPFPPPGYLPDPRIKPMSPASPPLAGGFFTTEPPGKPLSTRTHTFLDSFLFSLQFSCSVVSDSVWPHGLHARLPCPSPTPGAYSNSCPLNWWCHPTISSSVIPFSPHLHSFPASGSFPMSYFLASDSQSIGVSASTSALPMNLQDWFPLGWTGLISLQSKGLSRVFSNTTVQKHQFFSSQLSLQSNSHIHTWLLEKQ